MQPMPRARAIASLAAAILLLASTSAFAQPAPNRSTDGPPPYRLGTAARPFGWATAIGDLNDDGTPDYAIADRVGGISGGFAYSLEVWIAGVGSQSVSFDAADPALAVSLLDVDHDRNLDVVVSAPISRTVVRVGSTTATAGSTRPPRRRRRLSRSATARAEPGGDQAPDICGTTAPRRPDPGAARALSPRRVSTPRRPAWRSAHRARSTAPTARFFDRARRPPTLHPRNNPPSSVHFRSCPYERARVCVVCLPDGVRADPVGATAAHYRPGRRRSRREQPVARGRARRISRSPTPEFSPPGCGRIRCCPASADHLDWLGTGFDEENRAGPAEYRGARRRAVRARRTSASCGWTSHRSAVDRRSAVRRHDSQAPSST